MVSKPFWLYNQACIWKQFKQKALHKSPSIGPKPQEGAEHVGSVGI